MNGMARFGGVVGAALAAAVAGCATPEGQQAAAAGGDCLQVSLARDFRMLDAENLVVYAPEGRPYHVELFAGCAALPAASRIGLQARTDRLCGGFAGDAVILDGGPGQEQCPVLRVQRLEGNELDELLWRFGRGPGGEASVEIPRRED